MKFSHASLRWLILLAISWIAAVACQTTGPLRAEEDAASSRRPYTRRSDHFVVHSDLSEAALDALLVRMEETLTATEKYWDQPLRGTIECYVVNDLKNWPDWKLPHPVARVLIGQVGGATVGRKEGAGVQQRNKALVFASMGRGVAEHEVVHAYCGQTFGAIGPDWYKEGMAQMLTYRRKGGEGLQCPPRVLKDLKFGPRRPLSGIVSGGAFSNGLTDSLQRKVDQREQLLGLVPLGDWTEADIQSLRQMHRTYAWSWLVCHMLDENPNYRARFRALGEDYLTRGANGQSNLFQALSQEMDFEFGFLLDHLAPGFRADLCHWDWNKRFRQLDSRRDVRVRIKAARGYQASGLTVEAGRRYSYTAEGEWTLTADTAPLALTGTPRDGVLWKRSS